MKPEPLGVPIDVRGRRVPQSLAAPFIARARLNRMGGQLRDMQLELRVMQSYEKALESLPATRIHELFDELQALLLDHAPAVVCDCRPDTPCPICEEKRWLSAARIKELANNGPGLK